MDISEILKPEIQDFIEDNRSESITNLALQENPFPNLDYKIILNQIEAKKKSKDKLPTWFSKTNIVYPAKVSVEQTSSEIAANFKSTLVTGKFLADLTGGFGVDCLYFSKHFETVIHCEINSELSEIVKHNFGVFGIKNVHCIVGDSFDFLKSTSERIDCIYIDPSRRNETKGKVFMLKDCLPNVPENLDFYFQHTSKILLKTAPILDITAGLSELKNVKNIYIIAIKNEVKELLWEFEKECTEKIQIKTINFDKIKTEEFNYVFNSLTEPSFSLPKKYLYEPNSAIMKSGGFNEISKQFSIDKLQEHSHLYTSYELIDFPGRVFEIQKTILYSKNEMKENFVNKKFNITIRNFPETVETIRKKWKIKEGGNEYSFFTTDLNNNKIALICTKI